MIYLIFLIILILFYLSAIFNDDLPVITNFNINYHRFYNYIKKKFAYL